MNPDDINEARLLIDPNDVCYELKSPYDVFSPEKADLQAPKTITGTISIRISRKQEAEERKRIRKELHRFKKNLLFRHDYIKRAWRLFKRKYLPKLRMQQRRGYKGKGCRNRNLRNVKSCQSMSSFRKR